MPLDQTQYTHAMELDPSTDKPMPKVAATLSWSSVILPSDIQSHYQQTIQTHNAVSVGASVSSNSGYIDTDGFNDIALNMKNDAQTTSYAHIYWSNDGVTDCGYEANVLLSNTLIIKSAQIATKARYFKLSLVNGDTIAHTMSAWAYLKA
jgi:hypothetical protein